MPSLRTLLLNNWPLKLMALLLASLMWLAVASEQFERRLIPNVKLEFRNKPENQEIVGPVSSKFEVELLAPVRRNILESELAIVIDLAGVQEGNRIFPLGPDSVRVPEGVEVIGIYPSRLVLAIERTATKEVPVVPRFEGSLPAGYEVRGVSARPATVGISGPASRVARVAGVTTEAINLSARTISFSTPLNVIDEGASVRIDRLEPVEVSVEIAEQRRTLLVHDIAIEVTGTQLRYQLRPARVAVSVSVPASFMGPLKAEQFRGVVDASEIEPKTGEVELIPNVVLRESLPFDLQIQGTEPPQVRLRLLPR
jgi:YbbR domain-containing protein